ncbi:hypothetical protein DAEQUDRAFT_456101 [Daedalea quercina L-15889]|uniref:Uncharacterized protein n=1 Tax=Daedalea quercina L-15889 TaxID=1314783 RepID=A0A165MZX0_9APHY|nr:hypothetical protein DAEQUDRAFT_456101 [Daedalea quercina L-15889]
MSALQHSIVSAQFGAGEANTLYRNYLSMIAPQKKLHIYKKSTQKLVLLAEAFALCCLQLFSAENEQGNKWDGFKLPWEKLGKKYEKLLKWYTTVLENINSWASWDPVHTLTQWNEMRLSIQNTQTTCPDPIRPLSQQKRMFPDDVSGGKVFMRPTMDETIATVTEVVSSR